MTLATDRFGRGAAGARPLGQGARKPYGRLAVMAPHKHILGFVDAGGEIRRPAMVWMQLLHKLAVRSRYLARRRAFLKPQYLIGLILGDRRWSTSRALAGAAASPRVSLALVCTTPSGKAAVEICL